MIELNKSYNEMNTKIILTITAITLGSVGIIFTFTPDVILDYLNIDSNSTTLFLIQILGALYFAFGMLNWMTRSSLIGGIYNRPIAIANFTHFFIVGLALIKKLIADPNLTFTFWLLGSIYLLFAVLFGMILFRRPINETKRGVEKKIVQVS
jgi:hypothetical protein